MLAAEPAFQHTTRIYVAYDIDRMNPLFVPPASLSAGMALALVRSFDPRPLVMPVLTAIATWTSTLVPFIVPGAVVAIRGSRPADRVLWALAGMGFAFTAGFIWIGVRLGQLIVDLSLRARVP